MDFTPSDSSGGESSVTPIILDYSSIDVDQATCDILNNIETNSVISLNEKFVIENEDTTSPAIEDSEESDIIDNVRLKLYNFQLAYNNFLSLKMRTMLTLLFFST